MEQRRGLVLLKKTKKKTLRRFILGDSGEEVSAVTDLCQEKQGLTTAPCESYLQLQGTRRSENCHSPITGGFDINLSHSPPLHIGYILYLWVSVTPVFTLTVLIK